MKLKKSLRRYASRPVFLAAISAFFLFVSPGWSAAKALPTESLPSFAPLAKKVQHSVVNIATTQVVEENPMEQFFGPNSPFRQFFGNEMPRGFFGQKPHKMETHSLGSGFVISKDGLILTNNHVIEKATEIKVVLENEKEYEAKIIGRDPKTDLALIQVQPKSDFPEPVVLGDSGAMQVGDWVMAVGNPFGLGHTVTTGIISATSRVIGAGPYDDFLQTDAAINPGNSGGPLFNMAGEVIGINSAIIAQAQGIGFAIPINIAKQLLPQLKTGKITRGFLGIMIQDITPELASSFGLKSTQGALVSQVTDNSPAAKAGLKAGDVVLRVNGQEVKNAHALSQMIADIKPGTSVALGIMREGKEKTIDVTLGTMPTQEGETPQPSQPEKENSRGMTVQDITPDLAQQLGVNPNMSGVVITDVAPGSPAEQAGLRAGYIIVEIDHKTVQDVDEFNKIIDSIPNDKNILLRIRTKGAASYVVVPPVQK